MLTPARFVHLTAFDVEPGWEQELDRWYVEQEQPRAAGAAGCLGVRRFAAERGEPKHLLVYELATAASFRAAPGCGPAGLAWDGPLGPHVTVEHALYEQIFPADGVYQGIAWGNGETPIGGLRVTRVDVKPEQEADVNAWYHEEHIPLLSRCPGAIGGRRFKLVEGKLGYLTIIYVTEPSVLDDPAWRQVSTTPWTKRLVPDAFGTRWGTVYRAR